MLDTTWPFEGLTPGAYRVLLVDPPWRFRLYSEKGENKSPQNHYSCMTMDDIARLPVGALAHPEGCALMMWATAPMLPDAVRVMDAWGFTYKSAGAWAKRSKTGAAWAFGTGYCFRSAAEFFLLGTRGRPAQMVRNVRNLIVAPVREHSRKPDDMHVMCEALWEGPRAELFARETKPDWDVWGNQTDLFAKEKSYE